MKDTFKNLKLVYGYGKKYRINLIIFTIISIINIGINIVPHIRRKVKSFCERSLKAAAVCRKSVVKNIFGAG